MRPVQFSRELVLQALCQWLISGGELSQIEQQFHNKIKSKRKRDSNISKKFFSNLFLNIPKKISILDEIIVPSLDRDLIEIGPTEKAALYIGVYELKFQPEVPYKVVINEAVRLTKLYGAEGAYKLINSSLDKIAQNVRRIQVSDKTNTKT